MAAVWKPVFGVTVSVAVIVAVTVTTAVRSNNNLLNDNIIWVIRMLLELVVQRSMLGRPSTIGWSWKLTIEMSALNVLNLCRPLLTSCSLDAFVVGTHSVRLAQQRGDLNSTIDGFSTLVISDWKELCDFKFA